MAASGSKDPEKAEGPEKLRDTKATGGNDEDGAHDTEAEDDPDNFSDISDDGNFEDAPVDRGNVWC